MTGWQRTDLSADLYAKPTEPPATCGLIYTGKRHTLSGPPEAAKTLAALIVGLEHARAGHGRFALVDLEMGPTATRLLLSDLGATIDEIRDVYYVEPTAEPVADDITALADAGVSLTIIDAAAGAYGVSGLDDNKRADAEKFANLWVDPLWRRGIATILIDHVTKSSEGRGRYAIGSERKLGGVDVHLGLEVIKQLHRGHQGLIRIVTHKDRPAHLPRPVAAELELTSDPTTHAISWTFRQPTATTDAAGSEHDWRPTALMEKVSRFLQEQTEPVSRNTIEAAKLGRQAKWVRVAIDALAREGYVRETPGPRGSRLYESLRPFTSSTSSDLVSPRPDEVAPTSSDLVRPLQGDEVTDEDEVERLFATYADEVNRA